MLYGRWAQVELQEGIAKYLAREIAALKVERHEIKFEHAGLRLSQAKSSPWRRNLPLLEAKKTVFNYVAAYNDFERISAAFLDRNDSDVVRFAAHGTTAHVDHRQDERRRSNSFRLLEYTFPRGL